MMIVIAGVRMRFIFSPFFSCKRHGKTKLRADNTNPTDCSQFCEKIKTMGDF